MFGIPLVPWNSRWSHIMKVYNAPGDTNTITIFRTDKRDFRHWRPARTMRIVQNTRKN